MVGGGLFVGLWADGKEVFCLFFKLMFLMFLIMLLTVSPAVSGFRLAFFMAAML